MEHEQAKKIKLPYPRVSSAIYYSTAAPDKEFSIFNFRSLKQPHHTATLPANCIWLQLKEPAFSQRHEEFIRLWSYCFKVSCLR